MKRMLFIIPWSGYYVNNAECTFEDSPERAPEGVVGLATYLASHGASVKIADMLQMIRCNKGDMGSTINDLWIMCSDFKPDIIGFSFFTARFEYAAQIYFSITKRYSEEKVLLPMFVAGGVHPTLLPEVTLKFIPFDALIIGEGEYPLLSLLKGDNPKDIKGIYFPGDKNVEKADVIKNLDDLPIPNWDLVDKNFYSQPSYQISNTTLHRVMPITFGRSCMYRCNFCAHSCFLSARCHSAKYFIKKMQSVAVQCGINTFVIQDSSIGNFRSTWEEVCHGLIALGTPYQWWANLRVNQVDEEFLLLMKKAGCIKLFFGFESGSQRILDRMNKRITVEQCLNAARLCHKIGIPFYTSYIVNYFKEEEEDLKLTEQLIIETHPTSLAVNKFSPIPGSRDYDAHREIIEPYINTIHDWTQLGMLISPRLFGNMSDERFNYWYQYLKNLKKTINNNEATDIK